MVLDPEVVHVAVEGEGSVLGAGNGLEVGGADRRVEKRRLRVLHAVKVEREQLVREINDEDEVMPDAIRD